MTPLTHWDPYVTTVHNTIQHWTNVFETRVRLIKMTKKFTAEQTLKLVELYRDNECLWNIHTESYRNIVMRRNALLHISSHVGIKGLTPEDIKQKIKSLRSTYYLELDKIQKSSCDNKYRPKVPWFEIMHAFIKNVLVKRKPVDNYGNALNDSNLEEEQEETVDDEENEAHFTEVTIKREIGTEFQTELSTEDPIETEPKAKKRKRRESKVTNPVNRQSVTETEDEYDIFGKHVASQLRKLSPLQYLLAQGDIQSTLTKCRLRDLEVSGSKDQHF